MKSLYIFVTATCLALSAMPVMGADGQMERAHTHGTATTAQALTDGLVKKVDKSAGRVTLSHGALPNGMPAMTMAFGVKDVAWLDQLKAGDKVRFAADSINGVLVVTRLERN